MRGNHSFWDSQRKQACRCAVGLCLFFLLLARLAFGQTDSAIQGTVKDSTGAVVPGAEVTANHKATQKTYSAKTNSNGFYAIDGLAAGIYDVTIKMSGFRAYQETDV